MKDTTRLLSIIVVSACVFRFLVDGISFMWNGHVVTCPSTSAEAYAAILAPVLGAHSYVKRNYFGVGGKRPMQVDSPDGDVE
jgi:hypothetical protein